MATSLEQLRRSIGLLIDRTDATQQVAFDNTNVDVLNEFIDRAERRFYRDEVARIPPFEFLQTHTLNAGDRTIPLPLGYLEVRYIEVEVDGRRQLLHRTSAENILNADVDARIELPDEFAYGSNNFYIRPTNNTVTVNVYYYGELARLTSLTGTVTDHWLLNNADDLILYWAAVEASLYFGTVENMLPKWEAKAKDIRDNIFMQDKRARQSGSTPRIGRFYRNAPRISPNIGTFGPR